ncbi:ATP-dependent helicase [Rudanella paleaurantiibacter]|uniref:ATP-dependent helicase n=1 Tax=Rudanella paleaurantiibacter TaxID=2614655 RepID=A0A7J5TSQ4_9BACT|nr:helicase-related protein [Rudanella paleaurantiibacter]KAB7726622.1 ATP-dependent helicase [Rudanella paleaurantiibacter]
MTTFSIGSRISVRGEDFLITSVKASGTHYLLDAEGISELVRGQTFCFDTALDTDVAELNPAHTTLRPDREGGYRLTRLFLETALRQASQTSDRITLAHKAAFNLSDYQLEPTLKALRLPRPRLLIADGVGLGKTIEAGILLTELIRRGRGQRIMVLALKSVLGQFQQELWHRFSIPLVRLDSDGLARIRADLPLNKNPFDYYDKTIISIDTLKDNARFRYFVERSRWDIIVIDECHTVTNQGSLRGELAQRLANQCESLVLLSATPHNGKPESFANLIRLIEPTAIPRSGQYGKADVEPYYVRRFKHHIQDAGVRANFQEREVVRLGTQLYPEEVSFLEKQQQLKIQALHDDSRTDKLFAIGLFKAYLSSPSAAKETITNRLAKLKGGAKPRAEAVAELEELLSDLDELIDQQRDARFDRLVALLKSMNWRGKQADNRLVIFAERIDTLKYLQQRLTQLFGLDETRVTLFSGSLSDVEQQAVVEDFGKKDSPIRLLLASDAGSQGVNLHYFCHQMINYDIPWSLITLEQRNGRIDRYGQTLPPFIYYLVAEVAGQQPTDPNAPKSGLRTDLTIIDNLTRKEEEVYRTLGDVGSVMKLYDARQEEKVIENALLHTDTAVFEHIEEAVADIELDFSSLFADEDDTTPALSAASASEPALLQTTSFYPSDSAFYRELTEQLVSVGQLKPSEATWVDSTYLELTNTPDLNRLLYDLPPEAKPDVTDCYRLTTDRQLVQQSITESRNRRGEWARFQPMFDGHPVIRYLLNKLAVSVDKAQALVARLRQLPAQSASYVLHGQVSNQLGQPVLSEFFVVTLTYLDGALRERPEPLSTFMTRYRLADKLYTELMPDEHITHLQSLLPDAIGFGQELYMQQQQQQEALRREGQLALYQQHLDRWRADATQQLQLQFGDTAASGFRKVQRDRNEREITTILDQSGQYYRDLSSLKNDSYLRVLAVFYNPE